MNFKKRFAALVASVFIPSALCFVLPARAQVSPIYVGGGIDIGMNFHQLNVPIYIDTLCGVFNSGNSILPSGFLLYERPLGAPASSLWIAPRLHLSGLGALIATPANEQAQARDISQPDSPLVNTNRVFHLSSSILSLGADLFVKYPLTSRLFLMGGPSLSYLIRRDANVTEIITSPSNAVFGSTGQSTRTVPSQQTPGGQILNGNSILATFTLGATLDIPVSTKVVLAPELLVTIPFNSLRQDYSWRVTTVSAGIALKFNIAKEPKLEVVKIEPEAPKGEIHASVQISGVQVDSLGREHEIPQPQLRVEEYVRREAYPQLNYIFFDEDSSQIPPRYHLFTSDSMAPFEREPAASFDPSRLSGRSALDIYHETLNILGHRLQQNPSTDVTLTGTNEGTGIEANAPALSKARADRVKQYLVNTWKIDPSRITVQAVNLPTNASSTDTKEGAEENRRVEITSSDPSLLDPLVITDTDRTMNPPKIRVRTTSTSKFALNQTSLVLRQGSRVLLGTNSSNTVQDWTPSANELPRTDTPLVATLDLRDSIGTQLEVQDSARVTQLTIQKKREERVRDTIIEHYNLITFDFDKAELGPRSERIVQEIARNVTGKDAITLRGYTDMTGDRQHNLTLSETRAANVEAALKQAVGEKANTVKFSEQGEGEINLVDNRLPEGRFLSRTVFVQVTRPVE